VYCRTESGKVNQDTSNVEEGCASSPAIVYLQAISSLRANFSQPPFARHDWGIDEDLLDGALIVFIGKAATTHPTRVL
jgi:hypothetical protein